MLQLATTSDVKQKDTVTPVKPQAYSCMYGKISQTWSQHGPLIWILAHMECCKGTSPVDIDALEISCGERRSQNLSPVALMS